MRKISVILLIVLWASVAGAAPFLVCDPDPACDYYKVYADGGPIQEDAPAPLRYDLIVAPIGGIAYTAECCNVEGCSAQSDPYLSLGVPGSPSNLRINLQP